MLWNRFLCWFQNLSLWLWHINYSRKFFHCIVNLLWSLLMRLQWDRLQAKSIREYFQGLVRDEKKGIFFRSPKPPQARKHNDLFLSELILHPSCETRNYLPGRFQVSPISLWIQLGKLIIRALPFPERKPPVRRIDGVSPVGERRRHHLGHECAKTRKRNLLIIKDEFLDHIRQKGNFHKLSIGIRHKDT